MIALIRQKTIGFRNSRELTFVQTGAEIAEISYFSAEAEINRKKGNGRIFGHQVVINIFYHTLTHILILMLYISMIILMNILACMYFRAEAPIMFYISKNIFFRRLWRYNKQSIKESSAQNFLFIFNLHSSNAVSSRKK